MTLLSEHISYFFPAEKPVTEQHNTQPTRLSASSSSSDSSSSSSSSSSSDTSDSDSGWEALCFRMTGSCKGPWVICFPLRGLNCSRATDDGAAGRIRRDGQNCCASKYQTKKEGDGAYPALMHPSQTQHSWEWIVGGDCKVVPFSGELAFLGQSEGRSISCKKNQGE